MLYYELHFIIPVDLSNLRTGTASYEAENLAMSYGISSIPCIIKFKDGIELERSIGFKPKEEIEKLIEG